jgi:hypothetical protein
VGDDSSIEKLQDNSDKVFPEYMVGFSENLLGLQKLR